MSDFVKEIHNMFDHIWDCEIDHPVYQDTVGELMEAVIQTHEKHKPTLGTNLAEVGTDCISRQAAQTELQLSARRYTVAHEAHGEGRVVWSEDLISVSDAMDTLRKIPFAQPEINCSEFPNNSDTISRQEAIDALYSVDEYNSRSVKAIKQLPPIQPEPHEIGYDDCANALLKMWMDNVLTDGDYYRIADKLNKKWGKTELPEPYTEPYKGVTE